MTCKHVIDANHHRYMSEASSCEVPIKRDPIGIPLGGDTARNN